MLTLYAHPFSSYCWKALIALREMDLDFTFARVDDAANAAEWERLWPLRKMPLLVDEGVVVQEATIIVEHLQLRHPAAGALIPADPLEALEVRRLDRLSDNYLMAPMQTIVADRARPEEERDPASVAQARATLARAYGWWEDHIAARRRAGREWSGESFGLVECATAPALFYADWVQPFAASHPALHAYRDRLLAHPSVARAVDEARPFRALFPFGDPGRD